jgi:hypothetical protein
MLQAHDIVELQQVTGMLAGGLAKGAETVLGVPMEVALTLSEAREQMRSLPGVIDNLNESFTRFMTVSTALKRMIELADEASAEISPEAREAMEGEFVNLARIVAADAGRHYYQGPQLSLKTQGHAWSAAKIIRYMEPVMANVERDLNEQKELIYEVVGETINFLNVVTECYPEAEGAGNLNRLISDASHFTAHTGAAAANPMSAMNPMAAMTSPAGSLLN